MTALEYCRKKINKDCDIRLQKHAAIAMSKSGYIIASAVNRKHNDGVVSDHSLHAEEALIRKLHRIKAKERFGYIRVIVVRVPKGREWGMSKPCPGCERLLIAYGIDDISYTDNDGKLINL